MSSPKRRKVSNDDTTTTIISPSVIPSAVLSTTATLSPDDAAVVVPTVEPKLDEIPKLILVDLQKNDPDEVEEALETLFNRMPTTDEEAEADKWKKESNELWMCGAPAALVLTMQKWKEHRKIQAACCGCITEFTYREKNKEKLERSIILCGGVETIVTALKAFPNSIKVQRFGFLALTNLHLGASPPIIQSERCFVNELEGLKLVQKAMKKFPEDLKLQEGCCGLLCNLSVRNEFHKSLIKNKVVSCIATALENHSEKENLKKNAKRFMGNLDDSDSDEEE